MHEMYCTLYGKKQGTTAPTKFLNHGTEFSPHPWILVTPCLDVERFKKNYCNGERNFIVTRSVYK